MEIRLVYQWADRLLATVFPPRCLLCLEPGQRPGLDLCPECEADLPWLVNGCPTCAAPCAGPTLSPCASCAAGPRPFDRAVAALHYDFPADALVRQLKYRGGLPAGRVLGTLLSRRLRRDGSARVDALVPVPLHRQREARRGFNQALELARVVGRALRLPVADDCCVRFRDTAEQARLEASRRAANVHGAFRVRRAPPRRIAIVDDVLTTGSTVAELARVLRDAGAERVEVWVAARAGVQR
jgi:ComF family protein